MKAISLTAQQSALLRLALRSLKRLAFKFVLTFLLAYAFISLFGHTPAQAQSLYDERSFRPMTGDHKAFRVGDALTVQVIENATAAANADTGTRRGNNLSAQVSRARSPGEEIGIGVQGDFDGGGRTARAGKLAASLTVTVREVLPNGDLSVAGEQVLTINNEQQRINIEGRVRTQDITDANVVLSSRLADARITYAGDGELADRQKPAWWRHAFDWLGF
jgi:flagellar L-ring protein precursor FlgH